MRVDRISPILIQILHEKKVYSSSLKLNIYYVCQYPKKNFQVNSSKLQSTHLFAWTEYKKKSRERYQCIRKQEKSTDTQVLAVKKQKLTDTICHEI